MNGAEAVPVGGEDVIVFLDCVRFWGSGHGWVAEFDKVDHNIQKEMSAVVHYLQGKQYNQVPELNFPNGLGHNSAVIKANQKQGYLQEKGLTIS